MPVYCLVDIWSNDEGYLFICKADERGDAVASLSESNEVIWKNKQLVCLIINETMLCFPDPVRLPLLLLPTIMPDH